LRERIAIRPAGFVLAGIALAAAAWSALDPARGALAVLLAALALLAAGAASLERVPGSASELTLLATLGGLAAAGRVLFAPVPGVQPVTVIVAASGVALGPRRGFAVGALAALASNFFLGQGPHTPWQMLAWGGCGFAAGLARRSIRARIPFALFCFALGFAYGIPMDLWHWYGFLRSTPVGVVLAAGFAFNVAHAVGNLLLALAAGPELRRVIERYDRRLRTEIAWVQSAS
jgi:energy-coupling factor transport system substrate-specific component